MKDMIIAYLEEGTGWTGGDRRGEYYDNVSEEGTRLNRRWSKGKIFRWIPY